MHSVYVATCINEEQEHFELRVKKQPNCNGNH